MQITKIVMVLILVSIVLTVASVLMSVGLSHAPATGKSASLIGSAGQHMNQGDRMNCERNMSTHVNAMQHMFGGIPEECEDAHD